MSLQGVQGFSSYMQSFVQQVREFTRDHAMLNRLIEDVESTDRMIAWSALDAVSDFNSTPHFTYFSLDELILMGHTHLLMRMTVCTLLESVGLLQTRNHLNYSDGGLNVGVNDKTPLIMNWLQYFRSTVEQKKQRVKVAINIGSILGPGHVGAHSELWAVNTSYLSYR